MKTLSDILKELEQGKISADRTEANVLDLFTQKPVPSDEEIDKMISNIADEEYMAETYTKIGLRLSLRKFYNELINFKQKPINRDDIRMLSTGICDNCTVPIMTNTGNGIDEPLDPVLYCHLKKREIFPELPEDRYTECEFYACR